jgi:hypothetical protein
VSGQLYASATFAPAERVPSTHSYPSLGVVTILTELSLFHSDVQERINERNNVREVLWLGREARKFEIRKSSNVTGTGGSTARGEGNCGLCRGRHWARFPRLVVALYYAHCRAAVRPAPCNSGTRARWSARVTRGSSQQQRFDWDSSVAVVTMCTGWATLFES